MSCRTNWITCRLTAQELRVLLSLQPPPRIREYLRDRLNAFDPPPAVNEAAGGFEEAENRASIYLSHRDSPREVH